VEIRVAVGQIIEETLKKENRKTPPPVSAHAMIDTGATGTFIREDLVEILDIKPVGAVMFSTPSSDNVKSYEYLIRLLFPNRVDVETIAIAAPLRGQHIQCLIGRDVLKHGVFIYTGYTETFTLSF
jgi:predicted aspartyl protease